MRVLALIDLVVCYSEYETKRVLTHINNIKLEVVISTSLGAVPD
jgi:hypothetical protein